MGPVAFVVVRPKPSIENGVDYLAVSGPASIDSARQKVTRPNRRRADLDLLVTVPCYQVAGVDRVLEPVGIGMIPRRRSATGTM